MILAIKNEKACYYNTVNEKKEILEHYKNPKYKVFSNYDKDYAKVFANKEKISGFCTNDMSNYEILNELQEEGIQMVKYKSDSSFYRLVILNNTYCLNSKCYLEYDGFSDRFHRAIFNGYKNNAVDNICKSIYYFADCKGLATIDAVCQYFMKYKSNFGYFPWTVLYKSYICSDNGMIRFEYTANDIIISDDGNKYKFSLKNTVKEDSEESRTISEISEEPLFLSFKDEKILKAIKILFPQN